MTEENTHSVTKRQWKKWDEPQRYLFNALYEYMEKYQHLFVHPKTILAPQEYWNTTAHNAAFMAAELVRNKDGQEESTEGTNS